MIDNSAAGLIAFSLSYSLSSGSVHTGIWYIFPFKPTGESAPFGENVFPTYTPLGIFRGNVAHSNGVDGLHFDDGIKTSQPSANAPEQYLAKTGMR